MAVKNMICVSVLALMAMVALPAAGAIVPYARSGKVISCKKIEAPRINNFNADELAEQMPEKPVYITVTIEPDSGRKISVADYTLEVMNNSKLPCLAVKVGDGEFDAAPQEIEIPETTGVTLLFAAEARDCVVKLPEGAVVSSLNESISSVPSRSVNMTLVPPVIRTSDKKASDKEYVFFEIEVIPVLAGDSESAKVECKDFNLTVNNDVSVKCVAARSGKANYSPKEFSVAKDAPVTLLFAVKAVDCIDELSFSLWYNLAGTGKVITLL